MSEEDNGSDMLMRLNIALRKFGDSVISEQDSEIASLKAENERMRDVGRILFQQLNRYVDEYGEFDDEVIGPILDNARHLFNINIKKAEEVNP